MHDAFSWGSRRFDLSPAHAPARRAGGRPQEALWREQGSDPTRTSGSTSFADLHEDTVAKAAGALGQTFAGAVLADDLVALEVLAADPGTDGDRLGAFGFSGGGGRAACCSPRSTTGSAPPWSAA